MRSTPPTLVALASALALTLAGCGGGGEKEATTSPAPTSTSAQNPTTAQSRQAERRPEPSAGKQKNAPSELPPPQPGSKAAAAGVPTSPQGDNSIQTWGLEASDAQRAAATKTVRSYLDARASRKWASVCRLLAAKPRREQEQFGGGASCAKAMASFAAGASAAVLREEAEIEILSFRVGSKYAFLIYRRPDGVYATALTREGGSWKLISVTPNPLT